MILSRNLYDAIVAQARRDAPHETCGMLGGRDGRALKIYPIRNTAENKIKKYLMDGAEQVRAMQDMDDNGYEITAIYHSHPVSRAYPSATDLSDAYDPYLKEPTYPGTIYIIVTLMNPDAPEMHGYLLDGETVTEVPLQIED